MDPKTTVGDAIAQLEAEIAEKTKILAALKSAVGADPVPAPTLPREGRRPRGQAPAPTQGTLSLRPRLTGMTVSDAAAAVLKEQGRPMHGLRELLPELISRGVKVDHTTLPTAARRSKHIEKTAPGTFKYSGPT